MALNDDKLYELYQEHWSLYSFTADDTTFLFRGLSRKEFREVIEYIPDEYDREEWVCKLCTIEPENFNFIDCKAGITASLAQRILIESGFSSLNTGKINELTQKYMDEMNSFQNQISCIISEAFPNLDIQEIEDFSLEKTLWYYSRAMYKLQGLRGMQLQTVEQETPQQMMQKQMNAIHNDASEFEEYDSDAGLQMNIEGSAGGADAPELAQLQAFMKGRDIF